MPQETKIKIYTCTLMLLYNDNVTCCRHILNLSSLFWSSPSLSSKKANQHVAPGCLQKKFPLQPLKEHVHTNVSDEASTCKIWSFEATFRVSSKPWLTIPTPCPAPTPLSPSIIEHRSPHVCHQLQPRTCSPKLSGVNTTKWRGLD